MERTLTNARYNENVKNSRLKRAKVLFLLLLNMEICDVLAAVVVKVIVKSFLVYFKGIALY